MRYCIFTLLALWLVGCGGSPGANISPEEAKIEERAQMLAKIVSGLDTAQSKTVPVAGQING